MTYMTTDWYALRSVMKKLKFSVPQGRCANCTGQKPLNNMICMFVCVCVYTYTYIYIYTVYGIHSVV